MKSGIKRDRGLSLIELMIGMVLGLILIGGAVSVYLASKRSFVEVEQVAALSDNSRFAALILTDSLRQVGFFGETQAGNIKNDSGLEVSGVNCSGAAAAYKLADNAYLFAAKSDDPAFEDCIDDAMPDTDVLVLKYVVPRPFSDGPRDVQDPNDLDGAINWPPDFDPRGKVYVLSNIQGGQLFDIGVAEDPSSATPSITGKLEGDVFGGVAWEYRFEVYYIRKPLPPLPPQLSRKTLDLRDDGSTVLVTEDMVEGVENLRLLFGYDSNNDGEVDTYSDVEDVTNWSRVQSVEVFMLLRSATADPQYTDNKSYSLGGDVSVDVIGEEEKHFRRLLSHSSISLRNPKLGIRGGA